jgi:methylglyoxal synthase
MTAMALALTRDEPERLSVALIAHDARKDEMAQWAAFNRDTLANCEIYATATTGSSVAEKLDLPINMLLSGPFGGDAQVGALISEGRLHVVFFFWDPLTPQPHDVDVKTLLRLAVLHDVPIACNRSSADLLISSPLFTDLGYHFRQQGAHVGGQISVWVRPMRADDLARCRYVFEHTTSEDRYCRFFQFKDDLDDAQLRQFVELGGNAIGLLAERGDEPVGMAHAWIDERSCAELGIIVSRDVRRQGVGRRLVERIASELRARGVRELCAYTLAENVSFDALARSLGMTRTGVEAGVATYRRAL